MANQTTKRLESMHKCVSKMVKGGGFENRIYYIRKNHLQSTIFVICSGWIYNLTITFYKIHNML